MTDQSGVSVYYISNIEEISRRVEITHFDHGTTKPALYFGDLLCEGGDDEICSLARTRMVERPQSDGAQPDGRKSANRDVS